MREVYTYSIAEVRPYIDWRYFFHAWQMSGKPHAEQHVLREDAQRLLDQFEDHYNTHAIVAVMEAYGDGDDIVIGNQRLPMLRQQHPDTGDAHCWSISDFVRPLSSDKKDRIGVFAATVHPMMEKEHGDDPYLRMLSQTVADRLAEATTERLHEQVRKQLWGYGRDENLTIAQMLDGCYQGIRPAVGYPSMPDTSVNFIIDKLIDMASIGIRLTEHGAMRPHASVSGLMISHPRSRYFNIGKIGEDQLADYACRRGIPVDLARKFLSSSMIR